LTRVRSILPPSPSIPLRVDSRKMRVPDPEISVDKRAEIQHRTEGNAVLDVEHFPEISYRSTAITKTGDAHWEVHGDLNLHERSQPVVVVVSLAGGALSGFRICQAEQLRHQSHTYRGGTVKVKDEVKIELISSNLISFRQMLNYCFSTPLQFVLRSS
jgi:hypothetical protein